MFLRRNFNQNPKRGEKREKKMPSLNIFLSSFVRPVVILLRKQLLVYLGYWLDAWPPITTTTAAAAVIKGASDKSGLIKVESSTSWLQSVLTMEDRTAIRVWKKNTLKSKLGRKRRRPSRKADRWLRPFSLLVPPTWQLTQRGVSIQLWMVNSVAVRLKKRGKLRGEKHAGCTAMF